MKGLAVAFLAAASAVKASSAPPTVLSPRGDIGAASLPAPPTVFSLGGDIGAAAVDLEEDDSIVPGRFIVEFEDGEGLRKRSVGGDVSIYFQFFGCSCWVVCEYF